MKSETVPVFSSIGIKGREKNTAVFDLEFFITKVISGSAERYAKKIFKPLHCKNLDVEALEGILRDEIVQRAVARKLLDGCWQSKSF